MNILLLDKNSNPKAPNRKGWYVISNNGNILEGPFVTKVHAQYWIDGDNSWINEKKQTLSVHIDEVYSSEEEGEYKWCVINDWGKILAGPFNDVDSADNWITNPKGPKPQPSSSQPSP